MTDRKVFRVGEDRKYREELVALFDFTPNYQEPEAIKMLEMKKDDRILLIEKEENGWWLGRIGNKTGYFPSNFVATKRTAGINSSQEFSEFKTLGNEHIAGYCYEAADCMDTDKNLKETSKKITTDEKVSSEEQCTSPSKGKKLKRVFGMEGYLKLEDKLKHLPFLKESLIKKSDSNSPNTELPLPPKIISPTNTTPGIKHSSTKNNQVKPQKHRNLPPAPPKPIILRELSESNAHNEVRPVPPKSNFKPIVDSFSDTCDALLLATDKMQKVAYLSLASNIVSSIRYIFRCSGTISPKSQPLAENYKLKEIYHNIIRNISKLLIVSMIASGLLNAHLGAWSPNNCENEINLIIKEMKLQILGFVEIAEKMVSILLVKLKTDDYDLEYYSLEIEEYFIAIISLLEENEKKIINAVENIIEKQFKNTTPSILLSNIIRVNVNIGQLISFVEELESKNSANLVTLDKTYSMNFDIRKDDLVNLLNDLSSVSMHIKSQSHVVAEETAKSTSQSVKNNEIYDRDISVIRKSLEQVACTVKEFINATKFYLVETDSRYISIKWHKITAEEIENHNNSFINSTLKSSRLKFIMAKTISKDFDALFITDEDASKISILGRSSLSERCDKKIQLSDQQKELSGKENFKTIQTSKSVDFIQMNKKDILNMRLNRLLIRKPDNYIDRPKMNTLTCSLQEINSPKLNKELGQNDLVIDSLDGSIIAASYPVLVKKAIEGVDMELKDAFLTTFRFFSSAEELTKQLVEFYNEQPPLTASMHLKATSALGVGQDANGRNRSVGDIMVPFKIQICNLVLKWATEYFEFADAEWFYIIKNVIINDKSLLKYAPTSAERIYDTLSQMKPKSHIKIKQAHIEPIPGNYLTISAITLFDIPDVELARQLIHKFNPRLTLMQNENFLKITRLELHRMGPYSKDIAYISNNKDYNIEDLQAPNLHLMADLNTKISFWIVSEILIEENNPKAELLKRVETISKFIAAANACVEHHDYDTAIAIVAGLCKSSVSRLSKTWKAVPSKEKDVIAKLQNIFDPSGNYRNYEAHITANLPSDPRTSVMPFFAKYLTQLTALDSLNDTNLNGHLVNFSKYFKMAKITKKILRYQTPSNFTKVTSINLFLNHQIQTKGKNYRDEELFDISLRIEPRNPATPITDDRNILRKIFNREST